MKLIKSISQMQNEVRRLHQSGKTIGFVPTMGALHEGHLSLVRQSRKENDVTVVSIFVNPLQFGPKEDLKKYPRPVQQDLALLKQERADIVFMPASKEMYPALSQSIVADSINSQLTNALCGKFRPGHFRGVLTVVAKLFNIIRPTRAYFGAKDYQQAKIIQKMNEDLNFGIQIEVAPTVREKDGLAMSSRNRYLSPGERKRAAGIYRVLVWMKRESVSSAGGRRSAVGRLLKEGRKKLERSVDKVQYLEIVDPETLIPLNKIKAKMLAATACFVGKTRLIDNVIIRLPKKSYQ